MRTFLHFICAALLCELTFSQGNPSFGQSPETKSAFEAADVHVSRTTRYPGLRGPMLRNGRYEIHLATMVDLVAKAYGVDQVRVLGGPVWLENDRFDVIAKVPSGTTPDTAKPMLVTLLADRFKLVVHNDSRPMTAYALKAGKHPQLKEADGTGDTGCKFTPPSPTASGGPPPGPPLLSYSCHNMTMAAFAEALHTTIILAPQYLNEKLVVDQTGLKGTWNFDFKYTLKGMFGPPRADGANSSITLFDAIEKQLGLELDPTQVPLPVIVVDSVNQKPSANSPNIAETLHVEPPPTEFEVATLKPTPPDFRGMRLQIQPGGRVTMAGINLKFLIEQAWDVNDEMLVGAPKWMETDRYDMNASAATQGPEMDIEDLWPMLRALITERFKMTSHMEDRPVTAYTLKETKPKMRKADPASRMKCWEGPPSEGKDPRDKNPVLARLITCQNITMAEFADRLKGLAPGYIHTPVLNATELSGGYDFTLSFSPAGMPGAGAPPRDASGPTPDGTTPAASEPNGAITLFEAVEKQLGLKLEAQKRPVPVLVIDHADQKPTEN
jgi:uncharacterized protein (TIGR03435 family)